MDPSAFAPAQRARVRSFGPAVGRYWAFVPESLPPSAPLGVDLIAMLSRADRAIGEIAGLAGYMPNWRLLSTPLLRREAVLSSRIEGTEATLSELLLFEVSPDGAGDDVREVANYVAAADHLLDPDRRLPMSLPLLLEAHELLMRGVRGGYATPGEFRRSQNWIGPPGVVLSDATFVPPPPEEMTGCLDAFEKYLHVEDKLPALLRIAAVHYQLEAIHPFLDGNGRVGRLVITALLVEWGLLPGPLLDISGYVEPRRDEYYAALLAVSTHGDWERWFEFFLNAILTQCAATRRRAVELLALRDDYRSRVATARSSALLPGLVDALFESPAMTIPRAKTLLGVTHRAATVNVEKLVASGILTEVGTAGRTRLFLAEEILAVLEGDGSV